MDSPHNPRFPFTMKVYRPRKENGEYVLDNDANPIFDVVSLGKVAMADGWMVRDADGNPVVDSYVDEIECGYRTNTRNLAEMGDVVVYNVTLHTPPFITPLYFDDILEITDYDRTFRAKMVKKATFNWGSDVWFDEIKN